MHSSIPHTGLYIRPIPNPSSAGPIFTISVLTSLLRATHPSALLHRSSAPPLLHRRHHRLSAPWLPRLSATPDDAAENGEQKKTTDTAADADNEIAVIVDPAAYFFGRGGAFTLALEEDLLVLEQAAGRDSQGNLPKN